MTKFGGMKMGVPRQMGAPKFKLFIHSNQTHEIFKVGFAKLKKFCQIKKKHKIWQKVLDVMILRTPK